MSTVGFGDLTPHSNMGKFLGSIVVFLSMIFLAMPMTLIVGKFSACYDDCQPPEKDQFVSEGEVNEENREAVVEAGIVPNKEAAA